MSELGFGQRGGQTPGAPVSALDERHGGWTESSTDIRARGDVAEGLWMESLTARRGHGRDTNGRRPVPPEWLGL